jgi:hypothetical protein
MPRPPSYLRLIPEATAKRACVAWPMRTESHSLNGGKDRFSAENGTCLPAAGSMDAARSKRSLASPQFSGKMRSRSDARTCCR